MTVDLKKGDCLELMKSLADESVDAVVTDPPYGINADKGVGGFGSSNTAKKYKGGWDSATPSKEVFNEFFRISKKVIIFGGNYFTHLLPQSNHWIVWDKVGSFTFKNPFSDCELIWTNIDKNTVNKMTVIQQGFVSEEKERFHPTQKPVKLLSQIIEKYTTPNQTILDPFMGSGTTGIAAVNLDRNFIGYEIDQDYFEIAKKRIKQAQDKKEIQLI
ncbi:MAG: DNA-methyltransferase [Fusobacteriaceae bacterium]